MLLDREQKKKLDLVLTRRFPNIEDLRLFLSSELDRNLDDIGIGTLPQLRHALIQEVESGEWTVELIEALHRVVGPESKAQLDSLGTVQEIQEARFHDECYVDLYPLVNRVTLRAKLRAAVKSSGKRILLVRGDRHSGKSHSLTHLRHVARSLEVPLAEIRLLRYGQEVVPEDFGPAIASALKVPYPENLDKKTTRWSVNFLDWLAGQLGPRQHLWLAFDFDTERLKVPLPVPVVEFISMLAENVAERMTSTRLFLIDYPQELPGQVKPHLERELVPPITDEDLVTFFVYFYRDFLPDADPMAIATDAVARAARVRTKIPDDPATRLEAMRDALIEECQELKP